VHQIDVISDIVLLHMLCLAAPCTFDAVCRYNERIQHAADKIPRILSRANTTTTKNQ